MGISRRKFLALLAAGVTVAVVSPVSIMNLSSNDQNQKKSAPNKNNSVPVSYGESSKEEAISGISLEGEVTDVDEDSSMIYFSRGNEGGPTTFQFEIYRVKTSEKELTLIYPGPQSIKVGDKIKVSYKPYEGKRIYYDEIARRATDAFEYGTPNAFRVQKGFVLADGLIQDLFRLQN